mgnify:CR=1 FL=1
MQRRFLRREVNCTVVGTGSEKWGKNLCDLKRFNTDNAATAVMNGYPGNRSCGFIVTAMQTGVLS